MKKFTNQKFAEKSARSVSKRCILWPFATSNRGYPQVSIGDSTLSAHRLVCEIRNGPPPTEHHQAAHTCGQRRCVNGSHLRWATPKENAADQIAHGTKCFGERVGTAKLTETEVREIKRCLAENATKASLARRFKISQRTIFGIAKGVDWSWV